MGRRSRLDVPPLLWRNAFTHIGCDKYLLKETNSNLVRTGSKSGYLETAIRAAGWRERTGLAANFEHSLRAEAIMMMKAEDAQDMADIKIRIMFLGRYLT